jgi:hypothetical protein
LKNPLRRVFLFKEGVEYFVAEGEKQDSGRMLILLTGLAKVTG